MFLAYVLYLRTKIEFYMEQDTVEKKKIVRIYMTGENILYRSKALFRFAEGISYELFSTFFFQGVSVNMKNRMQNTSIDIL